MNRSDFLRLLALSPLAASWMTIDRLHAATRRFERSERIPALFVGHGNPMNAVQDTHFTRTLHVLGREILAEHTVRAVLVISAHWLTRGTFVTAHEKPPTIHDFGGFPDELFRMQYPAPGAPRHAQETCALAPAVRGTTEWGLDHGAWTVLVHLLPEAQIPVFQLSIDFHQPMRYHFELASQLAVLRDRGVLIIGSGNIVHNLRRSFELIDTRDAPPFAWALEFDAWVKGRLDARDVDALISYERAGQAASLSVPTVDHYVPLLYTLGAANVEEDIVHVHESIDHGGVGMRTIRIG